MKIGFAQINPVVGNIAGNAELILESTREAEQNQCDLLIFPELVLTGYPPEDLLLKPSFINDNIKALESIAPQVHIATIIGFADQAGGERFNAAAWIQNQKIKGIYHKQLLPNYGVFDEKRTFSPGQNFLVLRLRNLRVGLTICEDIWCGPKPLEGLKKLKPDLVVNISGSPFHTQKLRERYDVAKVAARTLKCPVAYCNIIGGQDELVFDGGSFVMTPEGHLPVQCPQFQSGLFYFNIEPSRKKAKITADFPTGKKPTPTEEIHEALILGLRDYVQKNGFKKVTVGISGGVDSALVAALATEALGRDQVVGVTMPSRFNKIETRNDALLLASNLGIRSLEIPIQNIFEGFLNTLKPTFGNASPNIAEENLQARIRGTLLMALSNKFGWLVLTPGNKSEMSTGYCTLYGDTAGGFAILKDVLKTTVYDLARLINKKSGQAKIPLSTIARAPTAELKDNQRDEDSLGPYADLDPIIVNYVEKNRDIDQISKKTSAPLSYIRKIISLIDRSEYKRRQAPPGIKITPHSFGRDHRMPITNQYNP